MVTRTASARVLKLTAAYTAVDEGGYVAEVLDAVGVLTQGETLEETRDNLTDALLLILETAPHQLGVRRRRVPRGAITERVLVILPA